MRTSHLTCILGHDLTGTYSPDLAPRYYLLFKKNKEMGRRYEIWVEQRDNYRKISFFWDQEKDRQNKFENADEIISS